jgi:[ribosomal protein S5]-alanine N-acetyltransferase
LRFFKTDGLQLRLIVINDLESIHKLHSLPETDEFNTLGIPESIDVTMDVIKPWIAEHAKKVIGQYTFAIELIGTNQFVGLIALVLSNTKYNKAEVWYKLDSAFWGKGFATEALNLILKFGFHELKLHRIEAGCAVNNVGSAKVMEKAGMTLEGVKRQVLPLKTGWSDAFSYAVLATD